MKVIKLEDDAQHLILVETGDRLFSLSTSQSAIILGDEDESEGEEVKATTIYPDNLEDMETLPFSVTLTACVREFLEDPEWVMAARQRISEKESNKEA